MVLSISMVIDSTPKGKVVAEGAEDELLAVPLEPPPQPTKDIDKTKQPSQR